MDRKKLESRSITSQFISFFLSILCKSKKNELGRYVVPLDVDEINVFDIKQISVTHNATFVIFDEFKY